METKPRVSVISPVYKVAAVLPRFIESVLAQTDPDFEFILVDDGSPDDSGKICDEYAARDSRIRVIHQKNGGACAARNAGIEAARGEYFLILDSDDAASPLMIQWALRRQAQYPKDLIVWDFVTDLAEPWKVIAEPAGFLIAPRGWERVGDVSNVVFTNGAIARDNGELYIYYAASDTRLHVASTTVDRLLDFAFHTPSDPLRSRDCVAQRCALIDRNLAFLKENGAQ